MIEIQSDNLSDSSADEKPNSCNESLPPGVRHISTIVDSLMAKWSLNQDEGKK